MLIGYSMPAISNITISGGSWLTADGGAACYDGKPARKARFSWAGGNTTSGYAQITMTFAASAIPRIIAALGLGVPAGCRVDFFDSSAGSLSGTTTTTRTVRMPDGSVGIVVVAADWVSAKTGVMMRIYNDVSGTAWITNGTAVDVGEFVAMPGIEIDHGMDWEEGLEDPADRTRTRAAQLNTVRRSAYRTYAVPLVANSASRVRQGGLPNNMDWAKLRTALAGDSRCIAIPRWGDTTALDAVAINATALYGIGKVDSIRHLGGDWYGGTSQFEEIPAI